MNKDLIDLRKKNLEQLDAELISARQSQFGLRIKQSVSSENPTPKVPNGKRQISVRMLICLPGGF